MICRWLLSLNCPFYVKSPCVCDISIVLLYSLDMLNKFQAKLILVTTLLLRNFRAASVTATWLNQTRKQEKGYRAMLRVPLNPFKDACRSCQTGMWVQHTTGCPHGRWLSASLDCKWAVPVMHWVAMMVVRIFLNSH